ncbi:DivIVA domain-containing protein [Arthrobacter sp. AK01]|uniref:DivIVA domain-containing protein n=1 Tax=Micrococcaceae TaxID=1268 RepID=UPI001E29A5D9|nr:MULTISPECIES: DivIVA domain-containing protein [Micrococcaceae]MCD4849187.1 DivIVA domain-containing protein [Arthrobacter sp. AK01]MCP1414807.1 DivIVA domain-containing protein [Paenarthrobacter sp. A20]
MSFFLVFLAIVLLGAALYLGAGMVRGRSIGAGLDDPVPNLPPVVLPSQAKPSDVDSLRFALGLRGYRMDQVDQVLDDLRDQLLAKDREIERLNALAQPRLEDGETKRIQP